MKLFACLINFLLLLFLSQLTTLPLDEIINTNVGHDQLELEDFLFEGDMRIHPFMGSMVESKQWPDDTVQYSIDNDFDASQKAEIYQAMERIENISCITFKHVINPKTQSYARFSSSGTGCHAHVGFGEGIRVINLQRDKRGKGCFVYGVILHEIMHILGFYHQQSIYDRDDYVRINWENIIDGYNANFNLLDQKIASEYDVPYDYHSIMHYQKNATSKNGKDTIETKEDTKTMLGQREDLSLGDIVKLNKMYQCCNKDVSNKVIIQKFCQLNYSK